MSSRQEKSLFNENLSLLTSAADLQRAVGWDKTKSSSEAERDNLKSYLALQLAAAGLLNPEDNSADGIATSMSEFSMGILGSIKEKSRLLSSYRAPIDSRIEGFLQRYFGDLLDGQEPLRLPSNSLTLDRHGMARELSIPANGDHFQNELVDSYRSTNGILNNPRADRRTTAGTFHVVQDGLPIPGDKRAVPRNVFVNMFRAAMSPPDELTLLPYTSDLERPAHTWVSLMLRPLVCPAVPGVCEARTMETRFFVPGCLVSNLDFVESIFGNAGDPLIPQNDAGIDPVSWTGHTGCVILAPHLTQLTKKELGLPHRDQATERQIADDMSWTDESEKYNSGSAFKLTCRNRDGVVVTLIADNYYGYCKKEVKTQISYACNMMGKTEEEHAGGALAFASYSLGEEFQVNSRRYNGRTFADVARDYSEFVDPQPEGYGIDKNDPSIIYIPENAKATLAERCIKWETAEGEHRIPLSPEQIYIAPSGYKIQLRKHPNAPSWRLVGTVGEGVFCHKPCTVSGGGKSEISKSLRDYMLYGPIFIGDRDQDFGKLDEIFGKDYSTRWSAQYQGRTDYSDYVSRSVLDPRRSLGSVIKLLSPSPEYNSEYNEWLAEIPENVYSMVLIIKRFTSNDQQTDWRKRFGVDIVNGSPGHELKIRDRRLVGTYLRVGLDDSRWRTFKLRQDFIAAAKVQREDDISVSTVVPADQVSNVGDVPGTPTSFKFIENCEYRLFQRPDDAIHRGLDKQTEWDLSRPANFISNFQPLDKEDVKEIVQDAIEFDKFTGPMSELLRKSYASGDSYVVCTSNPRIVDGKQTKNPRYLQDRPDMVFARDTYVARRGVQFYRGLKGDEPIHMPVGAVLGGRRNNPPDKETGIRSLAVYSPIHYQELPELVMDYLCSLTGKSPSTTGAGSEGALTKGPFNALMPATDLNNMIVSMILTGLGGFSTAAGHIGPRFEVGHDISLLVPEIWCRLTAEERTPQHMIENGMLEKVEDFEYKGQIIPANRLGYRITKRFVRTYMARVFDTPSKAFSDEILRPESQDMESYADGILHIAEAQRGVAQRYLEDGGYELCCPPLKAIVSILATGTYEGKTIDDPTVRELFTLENMLQSDWYKHRLDEQQHRDIQHWKAFVQRIEEAITQRQADSTGEDGQLEQRLRYAQDQLAIAESPEYLKSLVGTLGADPMRVSVDDPSLVDRLAGV